MPQLIWLHFAAVGILSGFMLCVHYVHYPMFLRVPPSAFAAYHKEHKQRISWVVLPLMSADLLSGLALTFFGSMMLSSAKIYLQANLALLLGCWAITLLWAAPLHGRMSALYCDPLKVQDAKGLEVAHLRLHSRLMLANSVRTSFWILRALLLYFALRDRSFFIG